MNGALRLSLLLLLLRPIGDELVRPLLLGAACAGLLWPRLLRTPWLWLGLAALAGQRVFAGWPLADNHAYLLCYWYAAVGVALLGGDARARLAIQARRLIGLAFGFACL